MSPRRKFRSKLKMCEKSKKNLEPTMGHKLTWHYFSHVGMTCGHMGKIVVDEFVHICKLQIFFSWP